MQALADEAREFSEFMSVIAAAMRDAGPGGSSITADELDRIRQAFRKFMAAAQRTMALIEEASKSATQDASESRARDSKKRSVR